MLRLCHYFWLNFLIYAVLIYAFRLHYLCILENELHVSFDYVIFLKSSFMLVWEFELFYVVRFTYASELS